MIHIDFETRSRVDIKSAGSYKYAADASTEVMCLAYNLSGVPGQTKLWAPSDGRPEDLLQAVTSGTPICAHNAAFERAVWEHICFRRLGWPPVHPSQWRCTLAGCSRQGLPRSLEQAGSALGIEFPKDKEGRRIMLQLSKPDRKGNWVESPDKLQRLYDYCIRDVDAEIAIWNSLEEMPASELRVWQLDQEINCRGLKVDLDSANRFLDAVQDYRLDLQKELKRITGGAVDTPKQVSAMRAWLSDLGVDLPDLRSATVAEALKRNIDPDAKRVLEIRSDLSAASTGKVEAMIARADDDGRVRGNLVYHGAATGRWAGTGLQIQNFPRGSFNPTEVDVAREILPYGSEGLQLIFGNPIEVAKSSLRSLITTEKRKALFVCDYASIEARVLAWLCRQDDLVQEFREGKDVYVSMASSIYDVPPAEVTKDQRLVGKIAILGLGYGMGAKTFKLTCSTWGVPCKYGFAMQVVKAYRARNEKIKEFWKDINTCCLHSVRNPGTTVNFGRLKIFTDPNWMRISLPSGREIMYSSPEIVEVTAPWSKGYTGSITWEGDEEQLFEGGVTWESSEHSKYYGCKFQNLRWLQKHQHLTEDLEEMEPQPIDQLQYKSVVGQSRKWANTRTYGGKLTENVVQAIARDFLSEAMLRVDPEYPIVATVHDEIISEAHEDLSLERFESLMEQVPAWGHGCPIAVEGYKARRYRK